MWLALMKCCKNNRHTALPLSSPWASAICLIAMPSLMICHGLPIVLGGLTGVVSLCKVSEIDKLQNCYPNHIRNHI